jgi:hypothetical protein
LNIPHTDENKESPSDDRYESLIIAFDFFFRASSLLFERIVCTGSNKESFLCNFWLMEATIYYSYSSDDGSKASYSDLISSKGKLWLNGKDGAG